ncbi:MAG: four helix bundle protein [Gemmatimonadaceae bacterium]
MQRTTNLVIWQRSLDLAVRVNHLAATLRVTQLPGIANQIRRSASSIPANIAEGAGQESSAQFARFLSIALASAFELESHLVLIERIDRSHHGMPELLDELQQLRKMLFVFRRRVQERRQGNGGRV